MPAPVVEEVIAALEELDQIDVGHAAAGALGEIALGPEHDAGLVQVAAHPARHDADDAGVPVSAEEDDAGRIGKVPLRLRFGGPGDLALNRLALFVAGIELAGHLAAGLLLSPEEQLDRQGRVGDASAGVDPRAELEGDIAARHLLARLDPADFGEGTDAGPPVGAQVLEPIPGEDAVLVVEGHEVGHRAEGDEVQKVLQLHVLDARVAGSPAALEEPVEQLEDEPGSGEIMPGRGGRVEHVRVDQSHVLRQGRLGLVVVDDDHIDPEPA